MKDVWKRVRFLDRKCKLVSCMCCGWHNKGKKKKISKRRTRRRMKQHFEDVWKKY